MPDDPNITNPSNEPAQNPEGENTQNPGGSGLQVTIDADELAKLRQIASSYDEMRDLYARANADIQNLRKRMERDTEERARRKVENLLRSVLGGIDELDRACANATDGPLLQGVRMIREILYQSAFHEGVREIPSIGLPFDPKVHEVITSIPSDQPANTVVQEQRKGYHWGERVLRPTQVIIAAAPQNAPRAESPASEN